MSDAYYNQSQDMKDMLHDMGIDEEKEKVLKEWPRTERGDFICRKEKPMEKWMVAETKGRGRWEHDDVHETDYDGDYSIEYKCHSCGHIWKTEMPD
jgi:hypothetical protein